jgi:hypothetical protein
MKSDYAVGIDYAASVFNQLLRQYTNTQKQIKLVWNTSLGLVYLQTIHRDQNGNPILSEKPGDGDVSLKTWPCLGYSDKNIFFVTRTTMYVQLMAVDNQFDQLYLLEYPDLLLKRLDKLVNESISSSKELITPTYDAFWNFQTLDGSISLPFVSKDQLELKGVASLVVESLPHTE